jgi:protein ImuB
MTRRFVSIWFRYLATDWFALRQQHLRAQPFILRSPVNGRMIVTASNAPAQRAGIANGMAVADACAILPELHVLDDKADLPLRLLRRLGDWCIRFTPCVAVDPPDGLLFDATGCSHLWGGDQQYLDEITRRLRERGYDVRAAMSDTIGASWAVARFCSGDTVVPAGGHREILFELPPEALRLDVEQVVLLRKLGLNRIGQIAPIARSTLRRRFGEIINNRIACACGLETEHIEPLQPVIIYQERLPCMEPIVTATGIEIALNQLLEPLLERLQRDQKGLRVALFKSYRVDGRTQQLKVETNRPTHSFSHIRKLFDPMLSSIEPALGIELFVLDAPRVEDQIPLQKILWQRRGGLEDVSLSELVDRLAGRFGAEAIKRYLPDEHYWPERSFRPAASLLEEPSTPWRDDRMRPVRLLPEPDAIEVAAPIPDYPPMLFRYRGEIHNIVKADGPERIEQEWWLQHGQHRDYYRVEDEAGRRYWIFRLGHYDDKTYHWFLHGFFA